MARKQQSGAPGRFGLGVLLAGCAALLVDAAILGFEFGRLLQQSGEKALGFVAAAGMAVLHVSQSLAFDDGATFTILSRFLLLFCPLLVIAAGAVLVRAESRAGAMEPMTIEDAGNIHGTESRP